MPLEVSAASPAADAPAEAPAPADPDANKGSIPAALKKIEELDAEIKKLGASPQEIADKIKNGTLGQPGELLLLQRSLIYDAGYKKVGDNNNAKWQAPTDPNAGYNELAEFAQESSQHSQFLQWLLTSYETLQLYVTGGTPGGSPWWQDGASHRRSIQQFFELAKKHGSDIDPKVTTDAHDRLVYKKMMISAALGMNDRTRLWTGNNSPKAEVVQRYEIIKLFREQKDKYQFQKDLFDQLAVENMRWVFENRLANEEMPWLANYTLSLFPNPQDGRLNAYKYIEYRMDWSQDSGYNNPAFYDPTSLYVRATSFEPNGGVVEGGWAKKYKFKYEDSNFPNNEGEEFYLSNSQDVNEDNKRLWIPFEKGGVCGAVAKTYENLNGIVGVPASVCGQPAHACCPVYSLVDDTTTPETGDKAPFYSILNDSGHRWLHMGGTEVNHFPCDWRQIHKEEIDPNTKKPTALTQLRGDGCFLLLAQDAINDMEGYTKVTELMELTEVYNTVEDKLKIVDKALEVQPFNWDALTAKLELYKQKNATSEEWLALAKKVATDCWEYPYPMQSYLVRIEQETTSNPALKFQIEDARVKSIQKAATASETDSVQHEVIRDTANRLLGKFSAEMFTFSFDDNAETGQKAGLLKLGQQFSGANVPWQYSLDGGNTWTQLTNGEHEVQLSQDQLESISPTKDIKIQVIGVKDIYTIDITEGSAPTGYCVNNAERRIYMHEGKDITKLEVRKTPNGPWEPMSYGMDLPTSGEFYIRAVAMGKQTATPDDKVAKVSFDGSHDIQDSQIVHASDLKNAYASSHNANAVATRTIDGNVDLGEPWHNTYDRELRPWIVIDLGKERTITDIDYWNNGANTNGMVNNGEIWVAGEQDVEPADGVVPPEAFSKVQDFEINWGGGDPEYGSSADANRARRITLDKPTKARYIKIVATRSRGNSGDKLFFSAAEFQFYESSVKVPSLSVDGSLSFGDVAFNDVVNPLAIPIKNVGDADAVIESIETASDAFEVVKGDAGVAAGATNTSWTVVPKAGLDAGTYTGTLDITYHAKTKARAAGTPTSYTAHVDVSVNVLPQQRSITVAGVDNTDTSVTLKADLSVGAGAIEYALSQTPDVPADGWQQEPAFGGLTPNTSYYAFARVAQDGNYAAATSAPVAVRTKAGFPGLEIEMPSFDKAVYGYDPVSPVHITLENTGNDVAHVTSVAVDSDAFELSGKVETVKPGAADASLELAPRDGLNAGVHEATVTVSYANADGLEAKTVAGKVAFVVEPAGRTVEVSAQEVGKRNVVLAAAPSAGDGTIEFACSADGTLPTDGWQASSEFKDLEPGKTYYFFARVTGSANYADAVSAPLQVTTANENGQGGGSTGGSQGGGSTEGGSGQGDQGSSGSGSEGQNGTQAPGGASGSGSGAGAGATGGAGSSSGSGATGLPGTGDASAVGAAATGFAGVLAVAFGWRRRRKE